MEREMSNSVALATWEAMEVVKGVVAELGVLPPPRHHSSTEMDIILGRLRRAGEVCLPATRSYRDHCAKVASSTTLASLDKASCTHMDALATRSVVVATAAKVATAHRQVWKVSNVLLWDFWGPRGHEATMESLRVVQAQKAKGKVPVEGPEADE